ncbi:DNA-formamidopyrimidine glycosylase [Barrientosiimonas marina]|uniref:Formamidopyrimidine-DNA glycosylase n=1 Tax=Lentibacillus kimchii TaxID=1542911 RepID=A0ABW2UUQ2_9BACI
MPELPEVETIKENLKRFVINQTIISATVFWPNIIKRPEDVSEFKHLIAGQTIQDIRRKGKFLLFELDDLVLVSHLRMEGKYKVHLSEEPIDKHTHVLFRFENGEELRYRDVRKFGTMHVFAKGDELNHKPLNQLGPDPFDDAFTIVYLYQKLAKTDRVIKSVLLDQTVVAGLGNIYVDETLFKAAVHPLRKASTLTKHEAEAIWEAAIDTLQEAVTLGGTTIRSYVNSQGAMGMFQQRLLVYGQVDEPCQRCGEPIVKMSVGGRGTHVCIACQK